MTTNGADMEGLLEYLRDGCGLDFTGYKRASLARRIVKRMRAVSVAGYRDYTHYLQSHPAEVRVLYNTILINVTSFFRDENAWDFLRTKVIPDLLARRGPSMPLRIWSAGCASGEEAYSLAMTCVETIGVDAFRERVRIYGTDIDDDSLTKACRATYTGRQVKNVPPALVQKYFDQKDGTHTLKNEIRGQVIFGQHDLIQDAPIPNIDLLVCRNALMYFNADIQASVLASFDRALNDGGILFLGRAETMLAHASAFSPVDLKRRISTKSPRDSSIFMVGS